MRRFEFKAYDQEGNKVRKTIPAHCWGDAIKAFKIKYPELDQYDCVELTPFDIDLADPD